MRLAISAPITVAAVMLLLSAQASAAEDCGTPIEASDGWITAAPTAQGLDPAVLCGIGPHFEPWKDADVHAVVVVRNGHLVYENTLPDKTKTSGRISGSRPMTRPWRMTSGRSAKALPRSPSASPSTAAG
jgi:hypothetical protein